MGSVKQERDIFQTEELVDMREKFVDEEQFIDFDLHIAPDGHIIAKSVEGAAVDDISTEVPKFVQSAVEKINNRWTDEDLLKKMGLELCDWLFPRYIHIKFRETETRANICKSNLRLRLRIEAEEIASLPLEFLYRRERGMFLAIDPARVISRYLHVSLPEETVRRREGPLHMLAIIASPTGLPKLDSNEWEAIITESLAGPIDEGKLTFDIVKRATWREIRDALLKQKPDIVQFVGHGDYKDGKGFLALAAILNMAQKA